MRMKIAFLVDSFPSISETFILNQITGLIDRGHEVDIYATRPEMTGVRHYLRKKLSPNEGDTEKVHAAVGEYNLMERTYAAPTIPANPTLRPLGDIPLFVRNMVQNPSATIEALKHFSYRNYPDHLRKPEYGLFYTITPFLESPRRQYDVIHCLKLGNRRLACVLTPGAGAALVRTPNNLPRGLLRDLSCTAVMGLDRYRSEQPSPS